MDELDWRWLRSFVEVAEAGGMQAAALRSGISQPTLSRHIKQLESALSVQLFERGGRGVRLSPEGAGLLERGRAVHGAVKAFERHAVGLSEELRGSVRVTMTELFGHHFAPAWLVSLRRAYPHITIDLALDDSALNLLLREAEIAVRLFPPRQLDLVAVRCGRQEMGFYAARSYIAERGVPRGVDDLRALDLIGFDRLTDWIDAARGLGYSFRRDDFAFRCDTMAMHYQIARAGTGVAVIPRWLGEAGGLQRVLSEVELGSFPIYLAAPQDLHRNPRVAKVWAHLRAALTRMFGEGEQDPPAPGGDGGA